LKNQMQELLKKRKQGECLGIYSACSANEFVLKAVLEAGKINNTPVLIEATANQCNQYGGYMNILPSGFMDYVLNIAESVGFQKEMLILGGDHLGPLIWQNENEISAMEKSRELVRQYVSAGFTKIHIDTSMRLGDDDKNVKLTDNKIANRAVELVLACEKAYDERKVSHPLAAAPVYVIGSEVPIPGGAVEHEEGITVTSPDEFSNTYATFKDAFCKAGLDRAFERVIAVVVQPGVEFGDDQVIEYDRKAAVKLTDALKDYKGIVSAKLYSAVELTETQLAGVKSKLASLLGKQIEIEASVDPSLIGGLLIKADEYLFDSTIKKHLQTLKRQLHENQLQVTS